jgi:guanylate kinase
MFPDIFQAPLMHTSRAPRAGEENGVHYNFVQKSDIEGGISRGEYIHYHQEKNSYFALKISTIDAIRKGGRIALVDLDMADVKLVKQSMMVVKTIFISPPSLPALDLRLKALAIEPLPKIQARMLTAKIEMDAAHADEQIDKIVTNDNVEQCCNRIVYQLDGWYPDFNFHENETGEDDH